MAMYSCGLRISEVVKIKTGDIDSKRMLIKISGSKGGKERNVLLSQVLLKELRIYWDNNCRSRNDQWLFPGKNKGHMDASHAGRMFKILLKPSPVTKTCTSHVLRHSWATHMLEAGTNIRYIQILMGHASINSTAIYTHLINYEQVPLRSPLDLIGNEIEKRGGHEN